MRRAGRTRTSSQAPGRTPDPPKMHGMSRFQQNGTCAGFAPPRNAYDADIRVELHRLRPSRPKSCLEHACVVLDCKLLNPRAVDLPPLPIFDHAPQGAVVGNHGVVGPQTVHVGAEGDIVVAEPNGHLGQPVRVGLYRSTNILPQGPQADNASLASDGFRIFEAQLPGLPRDHPPIGFSPCRYRAVRPNRWRLGNSERLGHGSAGTVRKVDQNSQPIAFLYDAFSEIGEAAVLGLDSLKIS